MVSEFVVSSIDGAVGVLTLNRPDKRNALTLDMRERLASALDEFEKEPTVRVAILQGAAPSFCAGVDLTESRPREGLELSVESESVSAPFAAFNKPIIAAVNGAAAGGGLEIALACDFIIASTTASFILPEVRIGSLPGGGGTQRLPRAIPRGVAARLLYTGDALDASGALAYGLVTEIVDPEQLECARSSWRRRSPRMPRLARRP